MITHDHKIIFVHIPKCAGRSVCDIFQQRFDHYTANFYQREYTRHWDRYNKFTIVRNPFDRLVSLYIYIKNHRRHQYEPIALWPEASYHKFPDFKTWLMRNITHFQGSFSLNSAEGQRGTDGDLGSTFWFSSQFRRLCDVDGNLLVSDVFHLEDGQNEVEKYLSNVTGMDITMPHVNKSEYEDFTAFYDAELVEIAAAFPPVKQDCIAFNYHFSK